MAWQGPQAGGGGFGQPPAFGSGGAASAGFGQAPAARPSGFAAFSQQQPQQPAFGQPASSGFGFGAMQQPPQPASSGFGFGAMQQPPQPASGGFGAAATQQQQQQPASRGFGFAATQPQPQPPSSGFGFGAMQPQQPASTGFGFAVMHQPQQPASTGFGFSATQPQPQPPAGSAFGAGGQPSNGFGFGQQAQSPSGFPFGQASQAKSGFPFGQQAVQAPSPAQFTFGRSQIPPAQEADGEEMDDAALAAAKAAALASMPKFQAAGGGGGSSAAAAAPPPPPPKGLRRNGASAAAGPDAEEVARRAQRASRFGGLPAASTSGRESPALQPAPQQRPSSVAAAWASREGSAAPEGEEEDDEGASGVRSGAIVGTCEDMCPEVERERRSRLSDIQIFERPDLNNAALTSAELAVKRFARTIDDSNNAPDFFRTRGALARTMAYLRALLDRQDARLGLIHKFLWDRYRSVRQDLYIQGMDDEFSVGIYEEVVRFHLLSEHELCEEEASITEMEGFNSHLNMEQMNKALISLNDMYNKLAAAGRPAQHEAEFRAYHLLSLMGQHGKFKGDQQAFLSMLQAMRPDVRGSPAIQWVLKLQRAFASNNFVGFFKLVRQAPYLLACLSHIYFGQVRGRALRTLGDTLAPKADTPVALEISWLAEALMLDSLQEAQQLCAMHGYETAMQAGVPVVLLLKGAYVDPPPPVPRKRSGIISSMAPGARSLAVTTPGVPPLTAEEAAILERQRQEQMQRHREQEAQRAQEAAEQRRQQEAAASVAAAAAKRQQEEQEAARKATQARLQEQELQRQREAQLELQRQQQQALEEQRRQQEAEAHRLQQLAELRCQQEEQQRAAAEAERRRREAEEAEWRRREAAEAAERQRLAELERQRLEELRRQEEERRTRREAKRRWAMQRFYLARWRAEARRRIAERRRLERLAANLKACRVGGVAGRKAAGTGSLPDDEAAELSNGGQWNWSGPQPRNLVAAPIPPAAKQAIDLAGLAAPLLLQRSPVARSLFWKVLLAPPPILHASSRLWGPEQQRLQHLHGWLALQLQRGRLVQAASGSAYVEGPLPLRVGDGAVAEVVAELATCLVSPDSSTQHCGAVALAGASGIVMALPAGRSGHREVQQRLPLPSSMAARLPVLLVAGTDAAAQHWQQEIAASRLAFTGPVQVVSVEEGAAAAPTLGIAAAASSSSWQPATEPAAYSRHRLMAGLCWLAAHSPPQPVLKVAPVEAVARDALAAVLAPLRRSPAAAAGGLPAAQLLCGALQQALTLVERLAEHSARSATAAWQWPPPEVAPAALRSWHDAGTLRALSSALRSLQPDADALLRMAEDGSQQSLSVALHMQLAALESAGLPPLVLPPDVVEWYEEQLQAARAAPVPPVPQARSLAAQQQQQQQQQQQLSSSSLGQKRKWQPGSPPLAGAAEQQLPPQRSWAAVVSGVPRHSAQARQQGPAISRLPYWQQLQEQLLAEREEALGVRSHATLASEATAAPVADAQQREMANSGNDGTALPSAAGGTPLLQVLQQQAASERAATQRLLRLAH